MFNFRFLLLFCLSFVMSVGQVSSAVEEPIDPPHSTGLLRSDINAPQLLKAYDLLAVPGAVDKLPSHYSLEHLFEDLPVYDQKNIGSCTAHSVAAPLWALMKTLGMEPFDVSRLYVYHKTLFRTGMGKVEDRGASLGDTIKTLIEDGFCHETLWPYVDVRKKFKEAPSQQADEDAKQHKVLDELSVAWVGPNLHHIKLAIKNGFALSFGMTIYKSFYDVGKDGRVPVSRHSEGCLGGHAMTIVGYDDVRQAFRIRNSWGPDWGDNGYAWLSYKELSKMSEVWALRRISGAPEAEILLEGIDFVPSTATIPQDDLDSEDLAEQVEKTKL